MIANETTLYKRQKTTQSLTAYGPRLAINNYQSPSNVIYLLYNCKKLSAKWY